MRVVRCVMLPRQVLETSTCRLRALAGHLVLSWDLVEGGRMCVVLVVLVELEA